VTGSSPGAFDLGIAGITEASEIGAGGFGVVFRAVEADLGRTVAVKVLTGNLDESARNRFERERRAMGALSGHPNIVTVYRGGYTAVGKAYLVMEYLVRGSLAGRMHGEGPIPWAEVLKFGIQLSGALETAHRAGVLHRDIKPGNILLSSLGNAKLADFGIARLQGAPETRSAVVTASLAHAAPDIVTGARPNARSDVYSLASTMYELVSGMPPFVRPTDESMVPILARIAQDPVPPLAESQLPQSVFSTIELAMAKDPDQRPATAVEFGRLLVEAERQLGLPATALPIESVPPVDADTPQGAPSYPLTPSGSGPLSPPQTSSPHTGPQQAAAPPYTPHSSELAAATQASPGLQPPAHEAAASHQASAEIDATGGWDRPATGTSRRRTPPWLGTVAAASAAGVVLAGLALWLILTQDGGGGTGTTTPTDAADAQTTGSVLDQTTGPSDQSAVPAPDGYVRITDSTGSITLAVPEAWTDVEFGPGSNGLPYLGASTDFQGGFVGDFTDPGVSVTILEGAPDPDTVLDQRADPSCTPQPNRTDFGVPYTGRLEVLIDCGDTDAVLSHSVFVDEEQGLTAFMVIQMFDTGDLGTVGGTISNSLQLRASN
jgi:serine/threonine protein kinase